MVIGQGDVFWADLGGPIGSAPGYIRPVVVVQCDAFNESRIATTLCVPLTGNLKWANSPGNVLLEKAQTSLDKDSVANVSLLTAVDKTQFLDRVGKLPNRQLELIMAGIDVVLGR